MLRLTAIILIFISEIGLFSQDNLLINSSLNENKPLNFYLGLSYTNSIPLHDYSRDLMHSPQGFSISVGMKPSAIPISFGINADCLFMENYYKGNQGNTNTSTFADGWTSGISFPFVGNVGYGNYETPKDYYRSIKAIVPINVFARIESIKNIYFQPYAEISIGVNTQYVLGLPNIQGKFNFLLERWEYEYYYLTYFYGLALGTTININDIIQTHAIISNLLLNFKFRYIKGIRSASIYRYAMFFEQGDNLLSTQKEQSQIDLIFYSLGLEYQF